MTDREYLVHDRPMKAILVFAIPMMLASFFQQIYTLADSIIVGRFIGEGALAAVGASTALVNVFIAVATSGATGASVITGRAFGAGRQSELKDGIVTCIVFFTALSVLLSVAGLVFCRRIMVALGTPADILDDSVLYLGIYFLGLPFLFLYNVLSSIFNSLGRSTIPLVLLVFSSLLNIVLDIVAVAFLGMGIAGAAWATLFSQALSAVISSIVLARVVGEFKDCPRGTFSSGSLRQMLSIAVPSILQQSSITIGMMLVQSVVNIFGSQVLAGYSAAIRVDGFVTVPFFSLGNAMSSYTAQNIGAGRRDRISKGYHDACIVIAVSGILISIGLTLFHEQIVSLFIADGGSAEARMAGGGYMSFLGCFYWILGLAVVTGGVLRGMGRMGLFTLGSIGNLALRVLGSMTLAPVFGVQVVWYVVPFGWIVYLALCLAAYRKCTLKGR